jgi:hypothetical protein
VYRAHTELQLFEKFGSDGFIPYGERKELFDVQGSEKVARSKILRTINITAMMVEELNS